MRPVVVDAAEVLSPGERKKTAAWVRENAADVSSLLRDQPRLYNTFSAKTENPPMTAEIFQRTLPIFRRHAHYDVEPHQVICHIRQRGAGICPHFDRHGDYFMTLYLEGGHWHPIHFEGYGPVTAGVGQGIVGAGRRVRHWRHPNPGGEYCSITVQVMKKRRRLRSAPQIGKGKKVLVPCGGTLDSTVLLVKALKETDHEIIAGHVSEKHDRRANPDLLKRQFDAFFEVVEWCRRNIRHVEAVVFPVVEHDASGTPFDPDEKIPLREEPGYPRTSPAIHIRSKWSSIGNGARELGVDECWAAFDTWSTKAGAHWFRITADSYHDYAAAPLLCPLMDGSPTLYEFAERAGGYLGICRFHNMKDLPAELRRIIVFCKNSADRPCGDCVYCDTNLFYAAVCEGRSTADLDRVQHRIEQLGTFGRGACMARPETMHARKPHRMLADHDEWRRWLERVAA